MNEKKILNNPVEEYFRQQDRKPTHSEIFEAKESDVELKTELDLNKITQVTTLFENDLFLETRLGIPPIFESYYQKFMRLMISKDRKSRAEFVEVNKNKQDDNSFGEALRGMIQR